MNQLQVLQHPVSEFVFMEGNQVVTDSLTISQMFDKEHKNVKRDIFETLSKLDELRGIEEIEELGIDFNTLKFELVEYQDSRNRNQHKYVLNFDAFMLVTMGYTTQKAMLIKMKYINEFNKMKEHIQKQPTTVEDAIIHSMTELKQIKERQNHTEEMNKMKLLVDNELRLTEQHKGAVQRKVKQRVFELKKEGYDNASYQGIYGALKRHFGVAKYDKIPRKYYQNAMRFIAGWYPPERPNTLDDYVS
ncbi:MULTISPECIES: ORF6C domain-containing protein [Bacillus cereus group]|uniref:ORF6C domain-containing protein n=1 Tax=Bacillus cereus group TaxID=86661 RepID=UPI0018CF39CB|nr:MULTISPECIES: ORF6C domain-containing protein [Bacillus cereus group]MBG9840817.1 Rha family transcriptional regulator [Bacillus tropicus]MBG9875324.1 Rha family transcriptional regulator [Bacillus tropicus]MBG9923085.1 Rha family transcriptional regulator [Bacillus tropicus]MBJ8356079.1 Rha family transcriptional regulator [Bacillus mycoides]MED2902981.1 ORF6C domain-containing protein [Bacillus tropicus]